MDQAPEDIKCLMESKDEVIRITPTTIFFMNIGETSPEWLAETTQKLLINKDRV